MLDAAAASAGPVPRPVCRYHGGKWRLAKWILDFFPEHRCYVEPFGGAGSVLLQKASVKAEIYSDLDARIVNLFRVLRNRATADLLRRAVALTPFSRMEFESAYEGELASDSRLVMPAFVARNASLEELDQYVESARLFLVRAYMGHGSDSATRNAKPGFRRKRQEGRQLPSMDWAGWPDIVPAVVERLQGVTIENRCAFDLMPYYDAPSTLFYVDPPYVLSTRSSMDGRKKTGDHGYAHELSDADHMRLVESLLALRGMVVLSGYDNEVYDRLLSAGWAKFSKQAFAEKGIRRWEHLWLNPAVLAAKAG